MLYRKRILTFPAPCSGVLAEILVGDGKMASPGQILGYIEDGERERV